MSCAWREHALRRSIHQALFTMKWEKNSYSILKKRLKSTKMLLIEDCFEVSEDKLTLNHFSEGETRPNIWSRLRHTASALYWSICLYMACCGVNFKGQEVTTYHYVFFIYLLLKYIKSKSCHSLLCFPLRDTVFPTLPRMLMCANMKPKLNEACFES